MDCIEFGLRLFNYEDSLSELRFFRQDSSISITSFGFRGTVQKMDAEQDRSLYNDELQERHQRDKTQEVKLTTRVNNTIFKTILSEYRKSILQAINQMPSLQWLRKQIHKIYGAKNQSVFPKLNFMVRQLHLQEVINEIWAKRSKELLHKKEKLTGEGKYSPNRYDYLKQKIMALNLSIKEPIFEKGFNFYWGQCRQHSKYENSKMQVMKFCKQFKAIATFQSSKVSNQIKDKHQLKKKPSHGKKSKRSKGNKP